MNTEVRHVANGFGVDVINQLLDDPVASTVAQALHEALGAVYVVGGAPRDVLLGKKPKDFDLVVFGMETHEVLETLQALPGRVSQDGQSFSVFRYRENRGRPVEVSLPRVERSTGPGHKDFEVIADPWAILRDDMARRDFTCNALAVSYDIAMVFDYNGGIEDIAKRELRVLSTRSFIDDPLRIMRALTAYARHDLYPEKQTLAWMREYAYRLEHLPQERCRDELDKIMESDDPARAIVLAHDTGCLEYFLPEVEACFGFNQNNPHHELELGDHLLNTLERSCWVTDDKDVRLAALLHDIGKPLSVWEDPDTGVWHYYEKRWPDGRTEGKDHAVVGADMTWYRLTALHYENARINRMTGIVKHHMYAGFDTKRGARRFLSRVGDLWSPLLKVRWADQGGKSTSSHHEKGGPWDVMVNLNLIEEVLEAREAFDRKGLAIDGRDLIDLGQKPGPMMGELLDAMVAIVITDPEHNTRDHLLSFARAWIDAN